MTYYRPKTNVNAQLLLVTRCNMTKIVKMKSRHFRIEWSLVLIPHKLSLSNSIKDHELRNQKFLDIFICKRYFIFYEVPVHVSKNLVLCSLHFNTYSFTNKAQFDKGFSKDFQKDTKILDYIWCCATQVWVTGFITWSVLLCLFLQIVYNVLCIYAF